MKQKKLLIVAQAPGSPTPPPPNKALYGSDSLHRLAKYSGVKPAERLYELADVVNLLQEFPGRMAKGDKFPMEDGVSAAVTLKFEFHHYARVVLLGSAVRECFARAGVVPRGMGWFDSFERWRGHKLTVVSVSPHPSGVSQFWNDPAARMAGEAFWRRVLEEAGA